MYCVFHDVTTEDFVVMSYTMSDGGGQIFSARMCCGFIWIWKSLSRTALTFGMRNSSGI